MPQKNFKNAIQGADKLFSINDTNNTGETAISDTQTTQAIQNTRDTQAGKAGTKKEYYRFNLKLDIELKDFVTEAAWSDRMTVSEYFNNLIRADRKLRQNDK